MLKTSTFDRRFAWYAAGLWGLLLCFVVLPVAAQEEEASQPAERIHITADRLVSEADAKTAEFIGNVRASQGDTVIVADRLKIFFQSGEGDGENDGERESIQKIVADGNVNIEMDDAVATTDQAVYIAKTDVLVLTGTNSKITSDKNSVTGDKITLYRGDDRMVVDGSGKERVEAILYSKDKGIQ